MARRVLNYTPMRRPVLAALLAIGAIASSMADSPNPKPVALTWPTVTVLDAATSATPDPPTGLAVSAVRGSTVTLRWTPPTSGPEPTAYLLEGGLQPGEVLGQVPVGATPEVTLDLPVGVLHVRIYSVVDSARSVASVELRVVVGPAEVPSAPAHLLGLVHGDQLTVAWRNTFEAGTPSGLWLEVAGTLSGALPLGVGESATYTGVPPGTYTLRVFAANEAGLSQPSPAITLNVPAACSGAPGPVTNVRSWRTGSALTVEWDAPTTGAAATSYRVHVSGTLEARLDTTGRRVSGPVPPGHYGVQVVATNPCGESAAEPPPVDWTTVVRSGSSHLVHFAPVPGAALHRVFWSSSRDAVIGLTPEVHAVDVSASPASLPETDPGVPVYYRVSSAHGPVVGAGGPVSLAPAFETTRYVGWPVNATPALFDANGDGCLDLVGAWGRCDGSFDRYDPAAIGLGALTIDDSTKARDSRFADFTGDGIIDIFTNVYTRADDLSVRAALYVGRGDGTFVEDPRVAALAIRGFGETILVADFDNDGDIDVFLPHYTHLDDGGHNWLLINDGLGGFHDVATTAGVAINAHFQPEGAQALDLDNDGWIDILVASHLFVNNGDLTFTDRAPALHGPVRFDEGLRLADVDLDGDFDLLHHDSHTTRLFRRDDDRFAAGEILDGTPEHDTFGYGLNVCDLNGDGFEDLLVAQNDRVSTVGRPRVLLNAGGHFVLSAVLDGPEIYNDLLACADLDGSGLPDIVRRWGEMVPPTPETNVLEGYLVHRTLGTSGPVLRLRVVDGSGRRNQQGRVVRIRPLAAPGRTLLRAVESGSGFMAQNGYDLLVAAPWPGEYAVEVRFAHGWVTTTARPGDVLTVRTDGTVATGLR